MHFSLELLLLVLESVLLIATIVLLVMSLKEGRSRDNLIIEVGKATRVLTRYEYFLTVLDMMVDAKKEVLGCITGRMPVGDDEKRMKELVNNIEKLVSDGVEVKYILPKFQDRLYIGWRYTKAGAQVFYSGCPLAHDLRYTIVDGIVSLIGVPESMGEKEATRKGYRIPSESLSIILRENFFKCLGDTVSYEEFLRETLRSTGATPQTLARELKIEEAELERVKRS